MLETSHSARHGRSMWLLPLIAGLLPLVASLAAYWISVTQGHITACNPFIEGCVSISRAGRHGLGNHVFRALMLPAATLQAITWLLTTRWLTAMGGSGRSINWLPWLGFTAGISLVLYGTFLGTEGEAYHWLRRYGVTAYFGFTFLGMLIAAAQLNHLAEAGFHRVPGRLDLALLGMLAAILVMGLFNFFARPLLADEALQNRIENTLEWFSGLGFTLFFCVLAWLWQQTGFSAQFNVRH